METQRIVLFSSTAAVPGFLIPVTKGGTAGVQLGDFLVVGRDPGCGLVLNDSFASSRHARIERKPHGYVVRDLHSKNGTFLNGSRMTEASLSANDRLRFGESTYIFSEAADSAPSLDSKNLEWRVQLVRLPIFAATDFPVLIAGPSGSGKEILARAIHQNSSRAKCPFVSINCSALSESLIESELFGHVRGSFTGATHDRKGAFETARGGTLFLDEIGDLPLSLQPKLLRALENNEIRPVGSDRSIETNVRILAATHKNLPAHVRHQKFREDLYYRLNVCQLRPPALRERMEDFEDLLYHFARQFRVRFSFAAVERLKEHAWPGNVRELRNVVARASAYFPGKHIGPDDLQAMIEPNADTTEVSNGSTATEIDAAGPAGFGGSVIKELEREMIIRRLVANQGNQRRTAHDLGIPKSTLHDRIRAYSIDLKTVTATGLDKID